MNKDIKKIIAKIMIGASLGLVGTAAVPSEPASAATSSQENLSMQTIYRENGYVIAKVNASYRAMCDEVYMVCHSDNFDDYKAYNSQGIGTTYAEDGTEITVEKINDNKYLVTFKINLNVFKSTKNLNAVFETETFGGSNFPSYEDTNNGKGYAL